MNTPNAQTAESWGALIARQAQRRVPVAVGLGVAVATVVVAFLASVVQALSGQGPPGLGYALLGGSIAFGATALGALPALVVRSMPRKLEDSLLGAAAGMMLAAAAFSLLLPGIDAAERLLDSRAWGALLVVGGIALGVLLMLGLDEFTPHEHESVGRCGPGSERIARVWLFVFAIALHNLPEGMAIGVSFAQADLSVGMPLTAAIALQDVPEGLAVALAMRGAGFSAVAAVGVAAFSGLLEPIGALLGAMLGGGLELAYPAGLGLAAGAMIFVVSHEVIPETHRNGHQTPATIGLMAGFALMMVLDTALG